LKASKYVYFLCTDRFRLSSDHKVETRKFFFKSSSYEFYMFLCVFGTFPALYLVASHVEPVGGGGALREEDTAMKKFMTRKRVLGRKVSLLLGPSILVATAAFADAGGGTGMGDISPLMLMFLIFIGVIVVIQLIPAMVIFCCCITAVCKRSKNATDTAAPTE
jgi:hypothetical protein